MPILRQNGGSNGGRVRATGTRIAEHDKQNQGQANPVDAQKNLERHRDRGSTEDEECSEPPKCHEVPSQCTEDVADEDRYSESREHGVRDEHDEAMERAADSRRSGTLGDPKNCSGEVATDEPADDQVEARQAPGVPGLCGDGVDHIHGSMFGLLDLVNDILNGG